MPSRKDESPNCAALMLGKSYSKIDIVEATGVAPLISTREWTGYVEFAGDIFLFVKLVKDNAPEHHKYDDYFDGPVFHWDSRDSHSSTSRQVQVLLKGVKTVHLFARVRQKRKGVTQPFFYCGRLEHLSHVGDEPVHFQWRLLDYPGGLAGNEGLVELASWRSSGHARARGSGTKRSKATSGKGASGSEPIYEGVAVQSPSNRYERDPRARRLCLDAHGYACWVCQFDFQKRYGSVGEDFAYVHHRIPVAARAQGGVYQVNPVKDLVPLCGNCHAMVHRRGNGDVQGTLSVDEAARLSELREQAKPDSWEAPVE